MAVCRAPESLGEGRAHAIHFLLRVQLPSGEFPTAVSEDGSFVDARADSNVFTTAIVLHALRAARGDPGVRGAARKAIRWLRTQRDPSGLWTFWGLPMRDFLPQRRIPPDVDCNACVVGAFKDWGADFPYEAFLRGLAKRRNPDGENSVRCRGGSRPCQRRLRIRA